MCNYSQDNPQCDGLNMMWALYVPVICNRLALQMRVQACGLQARGQAKAKQPAGALPVVVMSPLQLGHVNSCLTLPSELSSKVLAGQLQVKLKSTP